MRSENQEQLPPIAFFLQPYPFGPNDHEAPDGARFSEEKQINVDANGDALYCSRSKSMPTPCMTPGHTLPSGYTPSGKWKPQTYVPAKMDRRAGR